jgi:acetyl esterase
MATGSYSSNAKGYLITAQQMAWYWDKYVPNRADRSNPMVSIAHAPDLSTLPPAVVITAEFDPLRDEGEAHAARLKAAGVPVDLYRAPGQIHGFMNMVGVVDDAAHYLGVIGDRINDRFGKPA